jgi:signal transduction histidine kinase
VLIVVGSLWYSNRLVSELAAKEQRLVQFWARTAEHIFNHPEQDNLFLFENVLLISDSSMFYVPAILADSSGKRALTHNLNMPMGLSPADSARYVARELEAMRTNAYTPIRVHLPGDDYQWVYFRESDEVLQLRYFPYFTLIVVGVLLGAVFLSYVLAQRSQTNKVWVGLAKETAHQLGTPLTALIGWQEIIKLNAQRPDELEMAEELGKDIHQLEVITERFSKIGSAPELVPTAIGKSLEKSVNYYRKRASQKVSIELSNQLAPGLSLMLSPVLFEWVLENLIKNALDAGAHHIVVSAEPHGHSAHIEVRDDGKGIPPGKVKHVFKPGFTTKKRGWGLGLSLSRRIIEDYHRGRIDVKHSEVGVGTTFRIQLPIPRA